tara:strand:- start:1117 stop:1356 length:240 start_codon:yes stop_codon:yes gene_type:complete
MIRIGSSEILILGGAIVSFSHFWLSVVFLSLGVLGAMGRFGSEHSERQARSLAGEDAAENISTIVSSFVEKMNKKENIH